MNLVDLLGTLAGTFTTIAFLPQVIKTWRTGSAEDISLVMFLLFSTGVLLWLIYGIALRAYPIIIANGITLVLASLVLYLKIRYMVDKKRRLQAASQRAL